MRRLTCYCPGASTWNSTAYSPPKLGGVPSRSEVGAVCSKSAQSALLADIREAHQLNKERFADIYKVASQL
jgi:hypothetical protein